MKDAPCYECEDRHDNCHSHCEKYIVFKDEKEKERKERLDNFDIVDDYYRRKRKRRKF